MTGEAAEREPEAGRREKAVAQTTEEPKRELGGATNRETEAETQRDKQPGG